MTTLDKFLAQGGKDPSEWQSQDIQAYSNFVGRQFRGEMPVPRSRLEIFFIGFCGSERGEIPDCKGRGCPSYSEAGCQHPENPYEIITAGELKRMEVQHGSIQEG